MGHLNSVGLVAGVPCEAESSVAPGSLDVPDVPNFRSDPYLAESYWVSVHFAGVSHAADHLQSSCQYGAASRVQITLPTQSSLNYGEF